MGLLRPEGCFAGSLATSRRFDSLTASLSLLSTHRVLFDCWQLAFAIVGAGARSPRSRASMFGAYLATLEARTPYLIPESAAEIGDAAPERDLAPNHVEFLDQLADAYRFGALNAAADGDRALARRHIRLAMPIRRRLYGDLSDAVLVHVWGG